jgi:hypothetical protein
MSPQIEQGVHDTLHNESERWQQLSQIKACAFLSLQKIVVQEHNNLYLRLKMPPSG